MEAVGGTTGGHGRLSSRSGNPGRSSSGPSDPGSRARPLPARIPPVCNPSEGIAVGLSTRIPPHNLAETLQACLALLDHERPEPGWLARRTR